MIRPAKGYGFIVSDDGGKDVFVHIRDVEKAGFTALVEGLRVGYDLKELKGRLQADNLRIRRQYSAAMCESLAAGGLGAFQTA